MIADTRWIALMDNFGIDENIDTYNMLLNSYNEKHRYYHSLTHIEATLRHLDNVVFLATHPAEIEIALWFHDAIYSPYSKSNELDSANLASEFLVQNDVPEAVVKRVYHLILATRHNVNLNSSDEKLVVDIDLTILGCSQEGYNQFESNVRKEYKWIPSFIYKRKRKEILQSFLDRNRIYNLDYFHDNFDQQAQSNIQRAISSF